MLTITIAEDSGKRVLLETFDRSRGRFSGGSLYREPGEKGACLAVPPRGAGIIRVPTLDFEKPVTVHMKVKPPAAVDQIVVLVRWSDLREETRLTLKGLDPGLWNQVRFNPLDSRLPESPAPSRKLRLTSLKFVFAGASKDRVLLDDFEIRQ